MARKPPKSSMSLRISSPHWSKTARFPISIPGAARSGLGGSTPKRTLRTSLRGAGGGKHVYLQGQKVTVLPIRLPAQRSSVLRLDGMHNTQRRRKIRIGRAREGQDPSQGHEAF